MKKIVKRLELKRETVRTLATKTGIRTGDAVPDAKYSFKTDPDTGNSVSGVGGGRDGIGASDSKPALTIIGKPPVLTPDM